MNIAIILARKGSKRIKNKNIKPFFKDPIIKFSIEAAKKTNLFDTIYVSTNSKKIKKISEKYGAKNYHLRKKFFNDKATTIDAISWEIKKLEKKIDFDYVCCIYPASPLINAKFIKIGYNKIKKKKFDYVFSASKLSITVSKIFSLNNNLIRMFFNNKKHFNLFKKKQDLFYDSAQFYWGHKNTWKKKRKIFGNRSSIVEIPRLDSQDINTKEDWEFAKKLFLVKNLKKLAQKV